MYVSCWIQKGYTQLQKSMQERKQQHELGNFQIPSYRWFCSTMKAWWMETKKIRFKERWERMSSCPDSCRVPVDSHSSLFFSCNTEIWWTLYKKKFQLCAQFPFVRPWISHCLRAAGVQLAAPDPHPWEHLPWLGSRLPALGKQVQKGKGYAYIFTMYTFVIHYYIYRGLNKWAPDSNLVPRGPVRVAGETEVDALWYFTLRSVDSAMCPICCPSQNPRFPVYYLIFPQLSAPLPLPSGLVSTS